MQSLTECKWFQHGRRNRIFGWCHIEVILKECSVCFRPILRNESGRIKSCKIYLNASNIKLQRILWQRDQTNLRNEIFVPTGRSIWSYWFLTSSLLLSHDIDCETIWYQYLYACVFRWARQQWSRHPIPSPHPSSPSPAISSTVMMLPLPHRAPSSAKGKST